MNDNLLIYNDLLKKWQKTINLVSPKTLNDAETRHFDDSLQLAPLLPNNVKTLCDIGSGAGFPGLVLAMARPDIDVHLVESDTRKCAFMQNVSRETKLSNVKIHNDRIENVLGHMQADCVTARALAALDELLDYTKPLWCENPGFFLIAMKGRHADDEIKIAQEKYRFDVIKTPSQTDGEAMILSVYNIAEITSSA